MINLEDELALEYLSECQDHLANVETDLLAIEKGGARIDERLVNGVCRAVHSIKAGAGFFDLVKIRELAHRMEDVLASIRSARIVPTPERVRVLLRAADRLHDLIQNPGTSDQADIAGILADLAGACRTSKPDTGDRGDRHLRALLVEDEFASRLVLQTFLSRYGECHIAVNGREAVEAFRAAFERGEKYDLICMDIMLPEIDGHEAVRQVRAIEVAHGICSTYGVKIFMTTSVEDIKQIIRCFQELCDAYLMKPIDLAKLLDHMRSYQLVS
jgi:two-component system chemotaxis response regulator CheY